MLQGEKKREGFILTVHFMIARHNLVKISKGK